MRETKCIVNIGLFRSGTSTLVEAAKKLGMKAYNKFPRLTQEQYHGFLHKPDESVLDWFSKDGLSEVIHLATKYDIICDGWIALLPLLPLSELRRLKDSCHLEFVLTARDIESTVESELQHWIVHDLERKSGLSVPERQHLEDSLRRRALLHQDGARHLHSSGLLQLLPLSGSDDLWPKTLSSISESTEEQWSDALTGAGRSNANPQLPVEGILLTLRLGNGKEAKKKIASVKRLMDEIESDTLCRYLVVLALDADELGSEAAEELVGLLRSRDQLQQQLQSFHLVQNLPRQRDQPFAICSIWNEMAIAAWKNGADWVVLLGDDIEVQCTYHYRLFYHAFLEISKRLKVPFGFGCPWWNDISFPGFPSFICVGKVHFEIFGGLIPKHRCLTFVNQDLDPYVQRLYDKFMAADCVSEAILSNGTGGHVGSSEARYERVPASGWRDFVGEDSTPIRDFVLEKNSNLEEAILLDVIVPSYRVRLDYLSSICRLTVPPYMRTIFIIIVDNTAALLKTASEISSKTDLTFDEAERVLECHLSRYGNTVRVRCNKTNVGASASRNRGIDESAAEWILNLDDDLEANADLLEQYGEKLLEIRTDPSVIGLVGLVRFPRSPTLSLRHAAVLMSYLTFMFEVAEQKDMYPDGPAWGVTANILFRRTRIRFDLAYAKTGGGEDVDFSLRLAEATGKGARLIPMPEACVVHPFWPGSMFALSSHFFNWAIGDGALFTRHPKYRYWSFPNFPETLALLSPLAIWVGPWFFFKLALGFFAADFLVDFSYQSERKHRYLQLQEGGIESKLSNQMFKRSPLFCFTAHVLANFYVEVLECGRLWGHFKRNDLLYGFCRRFDWHIERLEEAPQIFRQREAYKFAFFVGILAHQMLDWQYLPSNTESPSWHSSE